MFLMYINQLTVILEKQCFKVKLFADYAKRYVKLIASEDITKLLTALDALTVWARTLAYIQLCQKNASCLILAVEVLLKDFVWMIRCYTDCKPVS
jgi:hypothetical protein